MPEEVTFAELARRYCERQDNTPEGLHAMLLRQRVNYQPDGWALYECQDMSSSKLGELTILCYGPRNTHPSPPPFFSRRGLASDQAVPVAILPADKLPETYP